MVPGSGPHYPDRHIQKACDTFLNLAPCDFASLGIQLQAKRQRRHMASMLRLGEFMHAHHDHYCPSCRRAARNGKSTGTGWRKRSMFGNIQRAGTAANLQSGFFQALVLSPTYLFVTRFMFSCRCWRLCGFDRDIGDRRMGNVWKFFTILWREALLSLEDSVLQFRVQILSSFPSTVSSSCCSHSFPLLPQISATSLR